MYRRRTTTRKPLQPLTSPSKPHDTTPQASADRSRHAGAKINLALHVRDRRPDGYHTIESLSVFADYGDVVTAEASPNGRMSVRLSGPFAEALAADTATADNLMIRAANALARQAPRTLGAVAFLLDKRLPFAAGLGGGSADAAAAMHLLNGQWNLGLTIDQLAAIGQRMGADLPMCLYATPLIATGIGEIIQPVTLPALPVVLAYPGGGLPTQSVFTALSPQPRTGLPPISAPMRSILDVVFWLRQTRNDLVRPAAEVSSLARTPALALHHDPDSMFARMSGSGTSAFGIFASLRAAERAADRIRAKHPQWWVVATMTGASPV
ncbi:MAG: 4-(cytidine 5'-diphospho)-2-C-methyl-D-erythritol kinase [Alphaproteobacteria bacterium]